MRRTRGITLVEVVIAFTLFVLVLVPLLTLLVQSRQTAGEAREAAIARLALEDLVERIQARASGSPADFATLAADLQAPGGLFEPSYDVPGLPGRAGGLRNVVVRVCLDETKASFGAADAPHYATAPWSAPPLVRCPSGGLDLNCDGDAADADTLASYFVLPLRIEVGWGRGAAPRLHQDVVVAPKRELIRD
jgi:type II secretory pathway pseudopilin PulG